MPNPNTKKETQHLEKYDDTFKLLMEKAGTVIFSRLSTDCKRKFIKHIDILEQEVWGPLLYKIASDSLTSRTLAVVIELLDKGASPIISGLKVVSPYSEIEKGMLGVPYGLALVNNQALSSPEIRPLLIINDQNSNKGLKIQAENESYFDFPQAGNGIQWPSDGRQLIVLAYKEPKKLPYDLRKWPNEMLRLYGKVNFAGCSPQVYQYLEEGNVVKALSIVRTANFNPSAKQKKKEYRAQMRLMAAAEKEIGDEEAPHDNAPPIADADLYPQNEEPVDEYYEDEDEDEDEDEENAGYEF